MTTCFFTVSLYVILVTLAPWLRPGILVAASASFACCAAARLHCGAARYDFALWSSLSSSVLASRSSCLLAAVLVPLI